MRFFQELIFKSWWVILFSLICYTFYERELQKRDLKFIFLKNTFNDLQKQKLYSLAYQENLLLQINSQSDPEWVELTLMKGLGLVPEGSVKAYFTPSSH
jgi:hypothetical protein